MLNLHKMAFNAEHFLWVISGPFASSRAKLWHLQVKGYFLYAPKSLLSFLDREFYVIKFLPFPKH